MEYNYDLRDPGERQEANQFINYRNNEKLPFLNMLLIANTRIRDFKDSQAINSEEVKAKIEEMLLAQQTNIESTNPIAFTFFNPLDSFFNILINYELIEDTDESNPEFLSFLYLHQVCHSYFGHFTRPLITSYREKNEAVTELILDSQINTFLIQALKYKQSNNFYTKKAHELITAKYPTYDKLFAFAQQRYGITPNFDPINDFVPVEQVMKLLKPMFDDPTLTPQELASVGVSMDAHALSIQSTEQIASDVYKSVEELSNLQNDSFKYLEQIAKDQGISSSDATKRQIEAESRPKSVLEIIKLTKTLRKANKIKTMRTWSKINRRKEYPDQIPMPGRKSCNKNHLVVGRLMPSMDEVR